MDALRLILILLIINLTGCLTVASSGAQFIYDRNKIKKNFNDKFLTFKAYQEIYFKTDRFNNTHVSFATLNSEVLLTGEIPTKEQQHEIESLITKLEGVKKVYNFTTLSPPTSTLTRVSDAWISTKITTKLIADNDIDPSQIKVITENGTVFLMGTVYPEQAEIATEIAKSTSGVQEITKLFSYISITNTNSKTLVKKNDLKLSNIPYFQT